MSVCGIPWSVVTRLNLHPIGCVDPRVYGLSFDDEGFGDNDAETVAVYHICEPRKARQMREALGELVHDQRMAKLHPMYLALCSIHRALTEET